MKRIFLSFAFILCLGHVMVGEINYFNKSWSEITAKARAEHKYIFIDCYTEWCGWCKVMDKETMTDPAIYGFINEHFIAVKMDMEHGEGRKIAMKYHIYGFPTFMFFNPDGAYVYSSVGYEKTKPFGDELANALNPGKQFKTPGFSKSLDIDFPEFYWQACAENGKRKFPKTETVDSFLDKQKDLFSEASWAVMARFEPSEKYNDYFLANKEKYESLYGEGNVSEKVSRILYSRLTKATKDKSETELRELLAMTDKYMKKDAANTRMWYRMTYYKGTKEWTKFSVALDDYAAKNGYTNENANAINTQCWDAYQNCDDKTTLTKACAHMAKAVNKTPEYMYMDTYAALLYKTGKLKDAEKWANKAIEEGKKEKQNVTGTEELLKKIKTGS